MNINVKRTVAISHNVFEISPVSYTNKNNLLASVRSAGDTSSISVSRSYRVIVDETAAINEPPTRPY
jgi:hypothetical protein